MNSADILQQRLANQGISTTQFKQAHEAVNWLAAVQAQDYYGAKWSLGLRLQGAKDDDIERAFNAGQILRTHILRPTWHFVPPADIRWMLALTAPRVHQRNAHMYRKAELDNAAFKRSHAALVNALLGGGQLTRDELRAVFERAGLNPGGENRMNYLLMQAELEGLICSGLRRGKQFTYTLLDERAPDGKTLDRHDALVELTRRFFVSRGPATAHDFAKWSGLTIADSRLGLEAVQDGLEWHNLDGKTYWFQPDEGSPEEVYPQAYLLSIYDEYISSYKGLDLVASPEHASRLVELGNALSYIAIIDGRLAGNWKREFRKEAVLITINLFRGLSEAEEQAMTAAAYQYGEFYGLPVIMNLEER
jgi:hypothetical protein